MKIFTDVEKPVPTTAENNDDNQVKSFKIKFPKMFLKEASDQAYERAGRLMAGGFLTGESEHSRIFKAEQVFKFGNSLVTFTSSLSFGVYINSMGFVKTNNVRLSVHMSVCHVQGKRHILSC